MLKYLPERPNGRINQKYGGMIIEPFRLIKQMRENAGLTQEELAELADISLRSLQRYETGKRKISLDVFWQLVIICKFSHLAPIVRKVLGSTAKQKLDRKNKSKRGKRKNASRTAQR